MKKLASLVLTISIILSVLVTLPITINAEANGVCEEIDTNIFDEYKNILSKTTFKKYTLYDIDRDQIPELIVSNYDGEYCGDYQIFSYEKNQIIEISENSGYYGLGYYGLYTSKRGGLLFEMGSLQTGDLILVRKEIVDGVLVEQEEYTAQEPIGEEKLKFGEKTNLSILNDMLYQHYSNEINVILNGDFSEFAGMYSLPDGTTMELLSNGLTDSDIADGEKEFRVEDITKESNGTYTWSVSCYIDGECFDGVMCILYPKNVEVVSYDGKILPTDTSKPRFWSGNAEVSDAQYIWTKQDDVSVSEIKVVLNGEEITFDQPPIMINDRVMVPIRAIFEAMGYWVEWDDTTQAASAKRFNNSIYIQIGQPTINYFVKNETGEYYCDVAPQIISNRTLVPVRAIAESSGCMVEWDDSTKTVYIDSLMDVELHSLIVNAQGDMTDNDAYLFKTIMSNNKLGVGAKDKYIHNLKEPNQETFERMIQLVASETDENDITYFFFSGHGGVSDDGLESVICLDYNYEDGGSFNCKMSELIKYLNNIPGKIVVILNSCRSGYINEGLADINTDKFKIITACKENEYASVKDLNLLSKIFGEKVVFGQFSIALIEGLGGDGHNFNADYNSDNQITLKELYQYINENMDKTYTYDSNTYAQNPTCSNPDDNIIIYEY